jgi:hypothetical protein
MQRRKLGQLEVSAVGLGCGTMTPFYGEPDRAAGIATIRRAREIGVARKAPIPLGPAVILGVRNVRLTRGILTVSATCRISETKIVCQQIRYSLRLPKRAARSSIRPSLTRNHFQASLAAGEELDPAGTSNSMNVRLTEAEIHTVSTPRNASEPMRGLPPMASQENGFALSTGFLPSPVDPRPELNNAAPSLQLHYRTFITTTSCPAPVPRIGTLVLMGATHLDFSLRIGATGSHVPCKSPVQSHPPSCRMPSGPKSGHPPDSSVPG